MLDSILGTNGRGSSFLRKLDRLIGIPLLWLLCFLQKKGKRPDQVRKIAVFKSTAIGDTIIMTGAIKELRRLYPEAKICIVCGPSNAAAANLVTDAHEVLIVPVKNLFSSWRTLSKNQFDLWIDFGSWPKLDAIISRFARAQWKIGFKTEGQHRHYPFDQTVNHSSLIHENENDLELVRAIQNDGLIKSKPELRIPFESHKENVIVLHLWPGGSRAADKEWPVPRWVSLAERLICEGFKIYLSGGPGDRLRNENIIKMISPKIQKEVINISGLSLFETAKVLTRANLIISIDTGIMHLASALKLPLIALHGPTHSKRWGPLNSNSVAIDVYPKIEDAPISFGYEVSPPKLMSKISVDKVYETALQILGIPTED